jgi:ABC-2 type transport system permease protein
MPPPLFALALAIAGKDWRLFWADRRAALLAFAVPIALASAFGLVFARQTDARAASKVQLAVVIEEDSEFAGRIAGALLASDRCEVTFLSRSEAEARVADRRPGVAIVLPPGFDRVKNWRPGSIAEPIAVSILHHPLAQAEKQVAEGILAEVVMRAVAKEKLGAVIAAPFRVEAAAVAGSPTANFNSYSHSFSGMTLQYLLFWGMESGLLLLRERQRGAWSRLRAAPVPLSAVLLGKALATAGIALLIVAVTFAFGWFAFGIRIQSWVGFACLAVAASGLAAASGLLVAAIGGSEARARSLSILVILGVSMLGGLWLPSFLLPGWLRDASLGLPTTWAMRGFDAATWQGLELKHALKCSWVVAVFSAGFLFIAAVRLAACESRRRRGLS